MPEKAQDNQQQLHRLTAAIDSGAMVRVRTMLNGLHPAEIAHLLESLPGKERLLVWELVDSDYEGDVLSHVNDEARSGLLQRMPVQQLIAATESMDADDMADILQNLPRTVIKEVLQSMSEQDRQRLETMMSYPDDSAGGLMSTDTITVRPDVTLDVVLRYLRMRGELPQATDRLIVVNHDDIYLGVLSLADLLTHSPHLMVGDVMIKDVDSILPDAAIASVAALFEHRDLISAPVIDASGKLLGRITIDDVVDVIREEGEHSLLGLSGLDEEEDMFAPVGVSVQRRGVWLGINLMTALLASWVIGQFEATIEKVVALAVLMPIVASMGGIAGTQTLVLVIRGIAVGQIGMANASKIVRNELAVGAVNGLLWALIVAVVTGLWFQDIYISIIIAVAIGLNLLVAAFAGAIIPLLLRKIGADPALGGGVMLTTVTDVVGFMIFLGLATLVLL